jgi:hypothetical protein
MKTGEHSTTEQLAATQEGLGSMNLVSYEDIGSMFLSNVSTQYVITYGTTILIPKFVKTYYIIGSCLFSFPAKDYFEKK